MSIHIQVGGGGAQKPPDQGGQEALVILAVLAVIGVGLWAFFTGKFPDMATSQAKKPTAEEVKPGKLPSFAGPCQPRHGDQKANCLKAKAYAYAKVGVMYKSRKDQEFKCLDRLWDGESGWDAKAFNNQKTYNAKGEFTGNAYGIPQALNKLHNFPYKMEDWKAQVDWGLTYINGRYKTPCTALEFWRSRTPHSY